MTMTPESTANLVRDLEFVYDKMSVDTGDMFVHEYTCSLTDHRLLVRQTDVHRVRISASCPCKGDGYSQSFHLVNDDILTVLRDTLAFIADQLC